MPTAVQKLTWHVTNGSLNAAVPHFNITHQTHEEDLQWSEVNCFRFMTVKGISYHPDLLMAKCKTISPNPSPKIDMARHQWLIKFKCSSTTLQHHSSSDP
jgi:hypothetical protein